MEIVIKENIKIIKKMGKEFILMQMEIAIKENGKMVKEMDKVAEEPEKYATMEDIFGEED